MRGALQIIRVVIGLWLLAGRAVVATGTVPAGASRQSRELAPVGTPPFTGYHRYRGTVGGRPVTVELTFSTADKGTVECQGTCRFDSSAVHVRELLSWHPVGPRQPLQLVEADTGRLGLRTGFWQAQQPAGPVLAGSWTGASGQQLPFELRENYYDIRGQLAAMPYELVSAGALKIDSCLVTQAQWDANPQGEPRATVEHQYLHFLGLDTLQAGIEALQCPPPADRQATVLQEMASEFGVDSGEESQSELEEVVSTPYERSCSLAVLYQGSGLLSWGEYCYYYTGGVHGGHSHSLHVYNLNEGTFLSLSELLVPGAESMVNRLIMRHLRDDEEMGEYFRSSYDGTATISNLPESGFAIVENGLFFRYADYEISGYIPPNPVTLTWAELQPLLRPDTPVAHMLRERGLWPDAAKASSIR